MKTNKFESKLHKELYTEMLLLLRKEGYKKKLTTAPLSKPTYVITPYKSTKDSSEGYEWLIFSVVVALIGIMSMVFSN